MEIADKKIDGGKAFDWGRTSREYAKYRDVYPQEFYRRIIDRGLCTAGQKVLDLGTGTGVLPRNLYRYGADWVVEDSSEQQIAEARKLSKENGMEIRYLVSPAEEIEFPDDTFDVITACQCFWYFDHEKLAPNLAHMIKKDGRLLILYMAWLPLEDKIAGASEECVLKYNPNWSGAGETKHPIAIPECMYDYFTLLSHEEYIIPVPFTRETWHGRMKACRGTGAALPKAELAGWEAAHKKLLEEIAPEAFHILHYAAAAELQVKNGLV